MKRKIFGKKRKSGKTADAAWYILTGIYVLYVSFVPAIAILGFIVGNIQSDFYNPLHLGKLWVLFIFSIVSLPFFMWIYPNLIIKNIPTKLWKILVLYIPVLVTVYFLFTARDINFINYLAKSAIPLFIGIFAGMLLALILAVFVTKFDKDVLIFSLIMLVVLALPSFPSLYIFFAGLEMAKYNSHENYAVLNYFLSIGVITIFYVVQFIKMIADGSFIDVIAEFVEMVIDTIFGS